jgi:hypothetical protein
VVLLVAKSPRKSVKRKETRKTRDRMNSKHGNGNTAATATAMMIAADTIGVLDVLTTTREIPEAGATAADASAHVADAGRA